MKSTPGPWELYSGWCPQAKVEENQVLISETPVLLDALEKVVYYFHNCNKKEPAWIDKYRFRQAIMWSELVISRAKGRE